MKTYLDVNLECTDFLNCMSTPMFVTDSTGTITVSNHLATKLLEKDSSQVIGKDIQEVLPAIMEQDKSCLSTTLNGENYILFQSKFYHNGAHAGTLYIMDSQSNHFFQQTVDKYESALSQLSEYIMGVDENGYVNFLSRSYAKLLGISNSDSVIGKHCTEVVENSRMHIVVETGKSEIGHLMNVQGKTVLATRIPIFKNGQITGAIGKIMFHDIDEFKALANQVQEMESKIEFYEKEIKRIQGAKYSFHNIVGNSVKIREVKNNAQKVAKSRSTILIKGETGTGKELFAHAIHLASPRSAGPFIPVNCAAIPKDLLEAELFGYESGAFTGANPEGKPGKFELAKNGTLFLDEIGDLPLDMQAKLLRVLENKEVERIGGTTSTKIDVRIIAATNKDLWDMTRNESFREDLYYRLNVFMINIPPLRERREDIIPIADHLIRKLTKEMGMGVVTLADPVQKLLMNYSWPGNIRELENVLERSLNVVGDEGIIERNNLPIYIRNEERVRSQEITYSLKEQMESTEKRAIRKALEHVDGNKQEAANLLGIHRASLYRKMEKYNIE